MHSITVREVRLATTELHELATLTQANAGAMNLLLASGSTIASQAVSFRPNLMSSNLNCVQIFFNLHNVGRMRYKASRLRAELA